MTWQQQLVARILLLIARMVTDDPELRDALKVLATHISVNAPAPITAEEREAA